MKCVIASVLCSAVLSIPAAAADFSFSGVFEHDNDVQLFTFMVGDVSTVELRSWSYAGGVSKAGRAVSGGGFDPTLALFNQDGVKIGEQDDSVCGLNGVGRDVVTGGCYDTRFKAQLAPGTYTASLQQWDNFAGGTLAAGFQRDGIANRHFRNHFVDFTGARRTGTWVFDILNVNTATMPGQVPEPASLALLALGLAGVAVARRRKAA